MQLGVEPDQALDRRLDEDAVGLPAHLAKLDEARRGLAGVRADVEDIVERLQRSRVRVFGHLPRSREAGQVRQHSRRDAGRQDVIDRARALVLDLGTGLVLPWLDHGQEVGLLDIGPGADHGHCRAVEAPSAAARRRAAGVVAARARGQHQPQGYHRCDESPPRCHVSSYWALAQTRNDLPRMAGPILPPGIDLRSESTPPTVARRFQFTRLFSVSGSKRCSCSAATVHATCAPPATCRADGTSATISAPSIWACSSSSLPRYSTTSTLAGMRNAVSPASTRSRCSGRKPSSTLDPCARPWISSLSRPDMPSFWLPIVRPPSLMAAVAKFMAGDPMKPATNTFIGWSYRSWGVPTC